MYDFRYLLVQVAMELPTLAVLITGGVLAASSRGRLSEAVRRLLLAGLAVLLVLTLFSTAWSVALPWVAAEGPARFGALSLVVGVIHALLLPAGFGLLIAAALAGRRSGPAPGPTGPDAPAAWDASPADAYQPPVDAYQPPADPYGPSADPYRPPTVTR
ncbi:hypothetical protein ABT008_00580 [Micromonospora sp. NPDC002389]|uniref:hypothetical protein n=1 Tax=Micromonospora sp. NPDC002389 TaxID=3154272 RepID=UPI0033171DE2